MKRSQAIVYLLLLIGLCLSRYSKFNRKPFKVITSPVAEKRLQEVTVHGDTRFDDYAWLREKDTQSVLDYLKAENKLFPELYPVAELIIQGVAKAVVRDL